MLVPLSLPVIPAEAGAHDKYLYLHCFCESRPCSRLTELFGLQGKFDALLFGASLELSRLSVAPCRRSITPPVDSAPSAVVRVPLPPYVQGCA
jgi:hypothetical protein